MPVLFWKACKFCSHSQKMLNTVSATISESIHHLKLNIVVFIYISGCKIDANNRYRHKHDIFLVLTPNGSCRHLRRHPRNAGESSLLESVRASQCSELVILGLAGMLPEMSIYTCRLDCVFSSVCIRAQRCQTFPRYRTPWSDRESNIREYSRRPTGS